MRKETKKEKEFNQFRFEGLNYEVYSNKYLTMDRVSENEEKIVVKVGDNHLIKTFYGYALVLDRTRVVFLKNWQVSQNYYGNEVLIDKNFWNVKVWGEHLDFSDSDEDLAYESWLNVAKEQRDFRDEDGYKNIVKWEF